MRFLFTFAILSTFVLLTGCGDDSDTISSDLVNTANIHANIHVTGNQSNQVFIDAELLPHGPSSDTRIVLSDSDELWATNDDNFNLDYQGDDVFSALKFISDTSMKLNSGDVYRFNFLLFKFSRNISGAWHTGELSSNTEDTYQVAMLRNNFSDADDNQVTIPSHFTITAPLRDENISRTNDLTINWQAGTDDQVSINIVSSCFNDIFDEHEINNITDDIGSYTVSAEDFSPNANGQCNTIIEVVKSRIGQLDHEFRSGIISGHRVAKVSLITTD